MLNWSKTARRGILILLMALLAIDLVGCAMPAGQTPGGRTPGGDQPAARADRGGNGDRRVRSGRGRRRGRRRRQQPQGGQTAQRPTPSQDGRTGGQGGQTGAQTPQDPVPLPRPRPEGLGEGTAQPGERIPNDPSEGGTRDLGTGERIRDPGTGEKIYPDPVAPAAEEPVQLSGPTENTGSEVPPADSTFNGAP